MNKIINEILHLLRRERRKAEALQFAKDISDTGSKWRVTGVVYGDGETFWINQ